MNVVAGLQGWTSPRSMLWPSAARAVVAMTAIALLLVNCCLADEPPAAAQADPAISGTVATAAISMRRVIFIISTLPVKKHCLP